MMKTLIKNIEIEFSLNIDDLDELKLELSERNSRSINSFNIVANGILVGIYNKILKTHIIIIN